MAYKHNMKGETNLVNCMNPIETVEVQARSRLYCQTEYQILSIEYKEAFSATNIFRECFIA